MATSCRVQQFQVEEEITHKIETWVEQQEQRCRNEPCNWWMLCLNVLVCWFVTVMVKIDEWVVETIIRWVYRTVCVVVTLVVGLVMLPFDGADMLLQALSDAWDLIKDAFFQVLGLIILWAITIVDFVQTAIGVETEKRRLTKTEEAALRPIFGNSLLYTAIRIVDGPQGVLAGIDGRAYTIGFTIYAVAPPIETVVHECVHVWQFQFGGAHYIGQSAVLQGLQLLGMSGDLYDWESRIGTGDDAWFLLDSVEAQAQFLEDVFAHGRFELDTGAVEPPPATFFQRRDDGANAFDFSNGTAPIDRTVEANGAWDYVFFP